MNFYPLKYFDLITHSLGYFLHYFFVVVGLCLIAALGRVTQLNAFGEITTGVNVILEIIIEAARVYLLLFVLGEASIKKGIHRLKSGFVSLGNKLVIKSIQKTAATNIRENKAALFINISAFILLAVSSNYLVDFASYKTSLLHDLKNAGVINQHASEWVLLLFFKNFSVIPFTIIFETILFLWMINKLEHNFQRNLKLSNQ